MTEKITVDVNGRQVPVEKGTTLLTLFNELDKVQKDAPLRNSPHPVITAKVNNELYDLSHQLFYDCTVQFLDVTDPNGFRAYQRTASFLMVYAAKTVLGRDTRIVVAHSVNKNFYCEFPDIGSEITEETLAQIEDVMRRTAEADLPIEKYTLPLETAIHIAGEMGLADKVHLLKYRRSSAVNFYKLDWFYDYFYGQMAPSTGCVSHFKLIKRTDGFVLQFPTVSKAFEIAVLKPNQKILDVFKESSDWARIVNADTVGGLNDQICRDGSGQIIRVAEALHEKRIAELADRIVSGNRSIVLIAGPSSSGKTTFSKRLGVQLKVMGKKPSVISLDNYYLNRDQIPRDEYGNYDFETIDALDTKQIDSDFARLLSGDTVEIPLFSFLTGKREPHGTPLKLKAGDVLIVEGIHGLNERISKSVDAKDKFKIFISALTQVNIDDHNRIPTTDTRLVRRIVRDFKYRAYSALRTIDMWPSVLRGENNYIFPYQEEADAYFNSALVYEMGILKQYAEPLLFDVPQSDPAYTEAKRLIKFLDCFLGLPSEDVPPNSILREFIGGSCF